MGKIKKGRVLKKAVSMASNFIPGGSIVKGAVKMGSSLMGSRGGGYRRRSRGLNLVKYQKKLIKAKMDAKIMKVKMSAFKGI